MSKSQTHYHVKHVFQKLDQPIRGKLLIHGAKHRDNLLQSL